MGEIQNVHEILLRKPESRGLLEGRTVRWVTNTKMRLNEIWVDNVD
jgi:hypothetical protein